MTHCNEPDYHVSPHHDLGADKGPPNPRQEGLLLSKTERTKKCSLLTPVIVDEREKSSQSYSGKILARLLICEFLEGKLNLKLPIYTVM